MKVKELVAKLGKLNQELDVLCYTADGDAVPILGGQQFFEPQDATTRDAETSRDDDGRLAVKFGRSAVSRPLALIEVIRDF